MGCTSRLWGGPIGFCCLAGTAFLVGGIKHSAQTFSKVQTHLGSGMLLMSCMCLLLPAALIASGTEVSQGQSGLFLSRSSAVREEACAHA